MPTTDALPDVSALLALLPAVFSRAFCKQVLVELGIRLSWATLTPLVTLAAMLYQRLQPDHTCDHAVACVRGGGLDGLDAADPHRVPLSGRLKSENTSALVQARERLPLALVEAIQRSVCATVDEWLAADPQARAPSVYLLDGTTFRLRPTGDLVAEFGCARNQYGAAYWVVPKAVASFSLDGRLCVGHAVGPQTTSEPALAAQVMRDHAAPGRLCIADAGFGVYRVAQVAQGTQQQVLLRLSAPAAKHLWRESGHGRALAAGQEGPVTWKPAVWTKVDPDMPADPVPGRLVHAQLSQPGFRPLNLYLFTTLDAEQFPLARVVEMYGWRWQAELNYRDVKTALDMAEFKVRSAAMFRLELAVGLLAYNLISAVRLRAAQQAGVPVRRVSFKQCLRRVADWLIQLFRDRTRLMEKTGALLQRLAKCLLCDQPNKVKHEPRQKRPRIENYGHLHGSRDEARRQTLLDLGAIS